MGTNVQRLCCPLCQFRQSPVPSEEQSNVTCYGIIGSSGPSITSPTVGSGDAEAPGCGAYVAPYAGCAVSRLK